jgi:hypothetical protein
MAKKPAFERYVARADKRRAMERAATTSPFGIEVRFLGGLTKKQKDAFKQAADRWCRVIVGDLPPVVVSGETIDDLLILAQGSAIDGPGKILGQAGPDFLRPTNAGKAAYLPAKGTMQFDTADLAEMETKGTLDDVITHEMGHVLGIGSVWRYKNLLKGANTSNPTFQGKGAMKEYGVLKGGKASPVPVEATGGPGTRDSHWRESVFGAELMTGYVANPPNPMSRMTVASLADLGYVVDLDAAEPYVLPNHLLLAERGRVLHEGEDGPPLGEGIVLARLPMVLPDDCLA